MNTFETFTTVISSNSSETPFTANNCWIRLGGLPNDLEFYCEVIDVALTRSNMVGAGDYLTLIANEGLEIIGGVQFPKRFNKICNIKTNTGQLNGLFGNVFKVRNFNGRLVNFQLTYQSDALFPDNGINQVVGGVVSNTFWTFTLKMSPIKSND